MNPLVTRCTHRLAARVTLVVALTVSSLVAAAPLEFFVAPGGADDASGAKAAPFATLARAQRAVRAELAQDRSRSVTVWLEAGLHELRERLSLDRRMRQRARPA